MAHRAPLYCVPHLPYLGPREAVSVYWGMYMCVRAQVSVVTCVQTHVCVQLGVSLNALEVGGGRTPSHGNSLIL